MYLGGVNRGIAFTRAGAYTVGLVLLLGFFATGSGYNGLFLSLGFGLSFLVISGLLSEKNIQASELLGLSDITSDAHSPFSIDFKITNRSPTWSIFSLENLVTLEIPKFRLMQPNINSLMEAKLLMLPPGQTVTVTGSCKGMPRGSYHRFYSIERTLFPFGMISKFKVAPIAANVSILPPIDPQFDALLAQDLRVKLSTQIEDREFHSHRPLSLGAPVRTWDMKKNAGRPEEQWVMKLFESSVPELGVLIEPDWDHLKKTSNETDYERTLSCVRTACEAIRRTERALVTRTHNGLAVGYFSSVDFLTQVPNFENRTQSISIPSPAKPNPGKYLVLKIRGDSPSWSDEPVFLG